MDIPDDMKDGYKAGLHWPRPVPTEPATIPERRMWTCHSCHIEHDDSLVPREQGARRCPSCASLIVRGAQPSPVTGRDALTRGQRDAGTYTQNLY